MFQNQEHSLDKLINKSQAAVVENFQEAKDTGIVSCFSFFFSFIFFKDGRQEADQNSWGKQTEKVGLSWTIAAFCPRGASCRQCTHTDSLFLPLGYISPSHQSNEWIAFHTRETTFQIDHSWRHGGALSSLLPAVETSCGCIIHVDVPLNPSSHHWPLPKQIRNFRCAKEPTPHAERTSGN